MRPHDIGWYLQGNQLDPSWYLATQTERIALYQYEVVLPEPTLAVKQGCCPARRAREGGAREVPVPPTRLFVPPDARPRLQAPTPRGKETRPSETADSPAASIKPQPK